MASSRDVTAQHLAAAQERAEALSAEVDQKKRHAGDPYGHAQLRIVEDRLLAANREVAELEREARRLEEEQATRDLAAAAEGERQRRDDHAFWFRRFHTSLALAHGAGFAAVSSKLFDTAVDRATAAGAWYPMAAFAAGMVLAGLIPIALFRQTQRLAWGLAAASAFLFVLALIAALGAVWVKAGLTLPV